MPTPTASEIIERVKARYAGCRTYEDEGEVTTTTTAASDPTDPLIERKSFRSAFHRPWMVLYSFTSAIQSVQFRRTSGAVWQDCTGLHRWPSNQWKDPLPPNSLQGELVMACQEGGQLNCDPFVLLGLLPHIPLAFPNGVREVVADVVDGTEMYVLEAPDAGRRVWVQVQTDLLVRVDDTKQWTVDPGYRKDDWLHEMLAKPDLKPAERTLVERMIAMPPEAESYSSTTTTVWRPRMDHAIDPKLFEFVPPG